MFPTSRVEAGVNQQRGPGVLLCESRTLDVGCRHRGCDVRGLWFAWIRGHV